MEQDYSECVVGFEAKKKLTVEGVEYWMARDLAPLLAYAAWDKFEGVIEKARSAAKAARAPADNHFCQTANMVPIGSGAERERADWYLSRYACYLIAMNGDSSKVEIGHAMTYFAGRTRQMELLEHGELSEERNRVRLRLRTIANNKRLAGAAKKAGVIRYGLFTDAGYRGLYGGMSLAEVRRERGVPDNDELLDRVGPLELAAHDFRITLTEDRLNRDSVKSEQHAMLTHRKVGEEVREVIRRDNGKSPENLPLAPSIRKFVNRERKKLKDATTRR